ncbi:M15 family metallopeptidase [Vreelandella stevensii]|uniref:M15 family metallopeptidase n=1 Tax=Vreelandella stevensii TaxID=502821 RepID=UPI00403B1A96
MHSQHDNLYAIQECHGRLLYDAMRQQGFTNLPSEWWHFDLGDQLWAHYGGHPHARYGPAELDTIENRWRRHIR